MRKPYLLYILDIDIIDDIKKRLEERFGDANVRHLNSSNNLVVKAEADSARQILDTAGVNAEKNIEGIIIDMDDRSGWYSKAFWEWANDVRL